MTASTKDTKHSDPTETKGTPAEPPQGEVIDPLNPLDPPKRSGLASTRDDLGVSVDGGVRRRVVEDDVVLEKGDRVGKDFDGKTVVSHNWATTKVRDAEEPDPEIDQSRVQEVADGIMSDMLVGMIVDALRAKDTEIRLAIGRALGLRVQDVDLEVIRPTSDRSSSIEVKVKAPLSGEWHTIKLSAKNAI